MNQVFNRSEKETYTDENIKKSVFTRIGSNDYGYSIENMTYHDTYFGTKFMGEEIIHWELNYYGEINGQSA